MAIHKITVYRVEVIIPNDVWQYNNTQNYLRLTLDATSGNVSAGADYYSDPIEWAEFNSLDEAKECERNLLNMIEEIRKIKS